MPFLKFSAALLFQLPFGENGNHHSSLQPIIIDAVKEHFLAACSTVTCDVITASRDLCPVVDGSSSIKSQSSSECLSFDGQALGVSPCPATATGSFPECVVFQNVGTPGLPPLVVCRCQGVVELEDRPVPTRSTIQTIGKEIRSEVRRRAGASTTAFRDVAEGPGPSGSQHHCRGSFSMRIELRFNRHNGGEAAHPSVMEEEDEHLSSARPSIATVTVVGYTTLLTVSNTIPDSAETEAVSLPKDACQHASLLRSVLVGVLDFDSTVVQLETIDALADHFLANKDNSHSPSVAIKEITAAAMRGELDFDGSFTKRVQLFEGVSAVDFYRVGRELGQASITPGMSQFVSWLARAVPSAMTPTCRTNVLAIASGGFVEVCTPVAQSLGMAALRYDPASARVAFGEEYNLAVDGDRPPLVHANVLEVDDDSGLLTGRPCPATGIVGPLAKAEYLTALVKAIGGSGTTSNAAAAQQRPLGNHTNDNGQGNVAAVDAGVICFAAGDGANDSAMLHAADIGIAFCAKPKLREDHELCYCDICDFRVVGALIQAVVD